MSTIADVTAMLAEEYALMGQRKADKAARWARSRAARQSAGLPLPHQLPTYALGHVAKVARAAKRARMAGRASAAEAVALEIGRQLGDSEIAQGFALVGDGFVPLDGRERQTFAPDVLAHAAGLVGRERSDYLGHTAKALLDQTAPPKTARLIDAPPRR